MKESLRDLMEFFLGNGELIYNLTMFAVVLILGFSAFNAYRKREKTLAKLIRSEVKPKKKEKEKPMSSFEFFLAASEHDENVTNEDYYKYRDDFEAYQETHDDELEEEEDDDTPLTRFEVLVEVYCPKLIWGCVLSIVLMVCVAAPYLIIKNFA